MSGIFLISMRRAAKELCTNINLQLNRPGIQLSSKGPRPSDYFVFGF